MNRVISTNLNPNKLERMKLYMRIWSGFTKLIRGQCMKERIIDSLYFGTYYQQGESFHYLNT